MFTSRSRAGSHLSQLSCSVPLPLTLPRHRRTFPHIIVSPLALCQAIVQVQAIISYNSQGAHGRPTLRAAARHEL
jgi:hypothetical protein